jgi:quercetin dioxygenase-like cupin family protein
MAKPDDVLDAPSLGVRIVFRRTTEETGGALLEFDVVGRPKGFLTVRHVHPGQSERHEVIEGSMRMKTGGVETTLAPGEVADTPAGQPHSHVAAGHGPGRVRVQLRPAGRTEAWLERLVAMDRDGQFLRSGWPRAVAGARLLRDFEGEAHAAAPSPRVQRAIADTVLRAHAQFDREYVFVDEWDVAAPIDATFAALSDARTYPEWWRPVYISVESEEPGGVGHTATQHFKGRLPYRLTTHTTTTRHEPPTLLEVDVTGDLRGRGTWTLVPRRWGTHVRFDWHVFADRPLLRVFTPILRPAFRANHSWAITRAREGLEPYAQRLAERQPNGRTPVDSQSRR